MSETPRSTVGPRANRPCPRPRRPRRLPTPLSTMGARTAGRRSSRSSESGWRSCASRVVTPTKSPQPSRTQGDRCGAARTGPRVSSAVAHTTCRRQPRRQQWARPARTPRADFGLPNRLSRMTSGQGCSPAHGRSAASNSPRCAEGSGPVLPAIRSRPDGPGAASVPRAWRAGPDRALGRPTPVPPRDCIPGAGALRGLQEGAGDGARGGMCSPPALYDCVWPVV